MGVTFRIPTIRIRVGVCPSGFRPIARAILSSLSHESGEVATRGVTALAALARGDDDDFDAAVRALVAEFAAGQTVSSETRMDGELSGVAESLLRRRGATALRRLCAELGSERTLVRLADVIVDWRGDDTRAAGRRRRRIRTRDGRGLGDGERRRVSRFPPRRRRR